MAHVNILSLPIETVQGIGNVGFISVQDFQISSHLYSYQLQLLLGPQNRDLKTLRLVCSQFNHAFESQVLSTLVISVTFRTLKQSLDMLRTFASQNVETSKAVQHARTLKIRYLSPATSYDLEVFRIPQSEPESEDLSPSPSVKRRLASIMSSLRRRFK
jgi:hypothetical protein